MSRHTMGPWRLASAVGRCYDVLAPGRLGPVAVVNPAKTDGSYCEGECNARLIAAAPEMLKALEAVFEWGCANGGLNTEVDTLVERALESLKAPSD